MRPYILILSLIFIFNTNGLAKEKKSGFENALREVLLSFEKEKSFKDKRDLLVRFYDKIESLEDSKDLRYDKLTFKLALEITLSKTKYDLDSCHMMRISHFSEFGIRESDNLVAQKLPSMVRESYALLNILCQLYQNEFKK